MKKYPYFLACAVPATFSALAWLITFTFLKEVYMNITGVDHAVTVSVTCSPVLTSFSSILVRLFVRLFPSGAYSGSAKTRGVWL